METTTEYTQQFFSVPDFREIMRDWHWTVQHKEAAGKYTTENEDHSMELFYRILSDEVLIMYEKTRCFTKHRSRILPNKDDKFYLLKFVQRQNCSMQLVKEGIYYELPQGLTAFCNNYGTHTAVLPKGYEGENLQIIISHKFIQEYINPQHLKTKKLNEIICRHDGHFFTMPHTPAPLKRRLNKLTQDIQKPPSQPMNKLHLLQKLGAVLEDFFQLHLSGSHELPAQNALTEYPARGVARYLDERLDASFPGMKFLANSFGISVSTLKNQFKKEFDTTPFRYYRCRQMQQARCWLEDSSRSVSEVAAQMGFNSSSNFIRAFKSEFDLTPGKMQQRNQSKYRKDI